MPRGSAGGWLDAGGRRRSRGNADRTLRASGAEQDWLRTREPHTRRRTAAASRRFGTRLFRRLPGEASRDSTAGSGRSVRHAASTSGGLPHGVRSVDRRDNVLIGFDGLPEDGDNYAVSPGIRPGVGHRFKFACLIGIGHAVGSRVTSEGRRAGLVGGRWPGFVTGCEFPVRRVLQRRTGRIPV